MGPRAGAGPCSFAALPVASSTCHHEKAREMRTWVKLTLTALAAALLLANAISTASAGRLSTSNQQFRIAWLGLEFRTAVTISCTATLEGSFHNRSIIKRERTLIGFITRAIVNRAACVGGTLSTFNGTERYNGITPANTLPWHVTYESFAGALPNISSIRLLLARARFGIETEEFFTGFCALQVGEDGTNGRAADNISADATRDATGNITTLTPTAGRNTATIIRVDEDPFGVCPREGETGTLNGTGQVFLLGSTTVRIRVTLI
jgi:hypothetical protein